MIEVWSAALVTKLIEHAFKTSIKSCNFLQ